LSRENFSFCEKQFSTAIIHSTTQNALNTIDNKGLLDINNEFHSHAFNSKGGWEGGESSEADSANQSDNFFADKVIKATEFLLNLTYVRDVNFTSASENIKLLSPLNSSGIHGNFSVDQNISNYAPHIPDYIRTTSIVFCVVILCLGLIGNIMVNSRKD
jgi:hypothetical protein